MLDAVGSKLSPIVKPLKALVKEEAVLTTVMGRPAGMLDFVAEMAVMLGGNPDTPEKVKTVKKLIQVAIEIDSMYQSMKELTGDTDCFAFGYAFNFVRGSGFTKVGESDLAAAFPPGQGVYNTGDVIQNVVKSLKEACTEKARRIRSRRGLKEIAEKAKKLVQDLKDSKYFKVPLLENPALALGLFSGKTVDIVEFTSPRAEIGADFTISIPIWSPPKIDIIIGGGVSISAQIIMGFDTSGIVQAIAQKQPLLAFDGFYILTERKKEDGSYEKLYQVSVTGYIELGVQLSIVIAKASAVGRITVIIDIGLVDPLGIGNPDRGKLRISTIALAFAARGAAAFMDMFRIRLRIILTLTIKIEIWFFGWSTVWKWSKSITVFDEVFEPEPFLQLADITDDGTLYVRIDRANNFVGSLSTVDVTVAHVSGEGGAESISIAVKTSYAFAERSSRQTFVGVRRIVQSSSNTVGSKPVILTVRGVLSNHQLEGNPHQTNHDLVLDFVDENSGVGGELSLDGDYSELVGASTIKFKHFRDVQVLLGKHLLRPHIATNPRKHHLDCSALSITSAVSPLCC